MLHRLAADEGLDRRAAVWGLTLPPAPLLRPFFLVPLGLIAVVSLRADIRGGVLSSFEPTLEQYRTLREKENYLRLLVRSAGIAAVVAASATALAYPVAYFLAFKAGRRAGFFLVLMLVPFWTSFLLRVMA